MKIVYSLAFFINVKLRCKYRLLLIICTSCIFFIFSLPPCTAQTYSNWQWLHPKPQGNNLKWCQFWGPNIIYAAGWYGTFIKTTNSGNTWFINDKAGWVSNTLTRRIADIEDMYFFNVNTGICCGKGGLMKTTNAGLTFDSIPGTYIGTDLDTWHNLFFLNNSTGYVIGSAGRLAKTTNGGNTWVFITTLPSGNYWDMYTPDDTLILALLWGGGNVQRSTDGGLSWSLINVGISYAYRINFLNRDTGFVCGTGVVKLTTNAGLNWVDISSGLPPNSVFTDIDFRINGTVREVYVTGDPNYIYKTTNFGASWDTVGFWGAGQLYGSTYTSTDLGGGDTLVTVGNQALINERMGPSNTILYTNYTKFGTGTCYDLWVENQNGKIWTVGAPSNSSSYDQIIYSSNGGATWLVQSTVNSTATFSSICMLNTSTGYVAGTNGEIRKTTNGGISWFQLPNPSANNILKIEFVDINTGWAFGAAGSVYKTTNSGLSWVQQNSGVTHNIYSADMLDANTGWFVGQGVGLDSSIIRKTTDGGISWVRQIQHQNGGYSSIFDIKMFNANTGYLCGFNAFAKTTNGGANWDSVAIPLPYDYQIMSMSFIDSMKWAMSSKATYVLITTDGGASWNIINTGSFFSSDFNTGWCKIKVIPGYIFATSYNAGVLRDSVSALIGVISWENTVPKQYELFQNYPNPFNPVTIIKFSIPKPGSVTLKVYDITGREVRTILDNMNLNRGTVKHTFDGSELASGVYFYSLYVDGSLIDSRKMILLK